MFEKLIISLFILFYFFQIIYYAAYCFGILFNKKAGKTNGQNAVSVIVSAKNEGDNLQNFLPELLNQDYKEFELIVVNDRSTDNSKEILSDLEQQYSRLSVITISENDKIPGGKKYALSVAINAAKYDYLLFTDADCYPVSKLWISKMMSKYSDNIDIILAYGAYEIEKGLLNKLIRFDTLFIAVQYFTYAKLGLGYMGVGRNLSYKKKLFYETGGFSDHMNILSGDDDLFISKAAKRNNIDISICKDSITKSVPKKTFKEWIDQKKRHLSTGINYKLIHKVLLSFESISKMFLYILLITALVFRIYATLFILAFVLRYIIQFFVIAIFSKKLSEKKILIFIPIFDILIPVINLFVLISNIFIKKKEWN